MTSKNSDPNHNKSEDRAYKNSQDDQSKLFLFNDEVNEFSYVVDCLIETCLFDELQAEQLTLLAHQTGKSNIKIGSRQELQKISNQLTDMGLSTAILTHNGNL
jgi:ATP-dependent Clp protease adapter protein ClpS